ncbi:MAG: hypothetical protein R3C59_21900 [Planctomycetaceae bacterium]
MTTNQSRTVFGRSTMHGRPRYPAGKQPPDVRHAVIVVSRMMRSADPGDNAVKERLSRAVGFLKVTQPAEEQSYSRRPQDLVFSLAVRILRCLRS